MRGFTVRVSEQSKREIDRLLNGIQKDTKKAMVLAINDTLPGTKTDVTAVLREEINLPKKIILHGPNKRKPTFKIIRATSSKPIGIVKTSGRNIPLVHYRTAPKRLSYRPRKIRVQIKKGGGESTLKHAFVPKLQAGHMGFFVRKGSARLPIKELFGPRIPDVFSNEGPTEETLKRVNARLDKNLVRAANRIIARNK